MIALPAGIPKVHRYARPSPWQIAHECNELMALKARVPVTSADGAMNHVQAIQAQIYSLSKGLSPEEVDAFGWDAEEAGRSKEALRWLRGESSQAPHVH